MESSDEETLQISSDQDKPVTPELFTSESANVSTRNPSPERFDEMYLNFTPSLGDYLPSPPTGLTTLMPDDEVTDSAPDSYLPSHKISVLQGITAVQPADQDEDPKSDPHSSRPQTEITAPMPVDLDADCYNMNHKYRGKCVVFNHEKFDTGFDARPGSTIDANRIEQTFTNLGFTVEILLDLEHAQVINKLTELSNDNHEEADCLCIFMLTHGISNDMICAKDVAYKTEKVWKPFTADKCTTLAGKPKLFFFQACRGKELDDGVILSRTMMRRVETDSSEISYKIPTIPHADFLIVHSSVHDFYLWRNPTQGTLFVQSLCEVLEEYSGTTDLVKMMAITARKIVTTRASYHDFDYSINDKKQVPSITSMLLRDVYFTPKE